MDLLHLAQPCVGLLFCELLVHVIYGVQLGCYAVSRSEPEALCEGFDV